MTPAPEPTVDCRIERRGEGGEVAWVTLDYRARLNILNSPLILQLTERFRSLRDRPELRAAVLAGAGERAFIGGADINEMMGLDRFSAEGFITRLHELCATIRALPVPVIAGIRGYCLGAGLEIAASCDLRVASRDSTFGMPEVRVGIPSVIEAALLPRMIGWGRASRLLLTGDMISAEEAGRWGLVEAVVEAERLEATVEAWLESIFRCGAQAVRLQKALLTEWENLALPAAIERGIRAFGEAYRGAEPRMMMEAFINRQRAPRGGEMSYSQDTEAPGER